MAGDRNRRRTPPQADPAMQGSYGRLSLLRRLGTYLWIGLVDPAPPRLPRTKPVEDQA